MSETSEKREGTWHADYRVDLSNPTDERLDDIKNKVVENIARAVSEEKERRKSGEGPEPESRDHHYNMHNRIVED